MSKLWDLYRRLAFGFCAKARRQSLWYDPRNHQLFAAARPISLSHTRCLRWPIAPKGLAPGDLSRPVHSQGPNGDSMPMLRVFQPNLRHTAPGKLHPAARHQAPGSASCCSGLFGPPTLKRRAFTSRPRQLTCSEAKAKGDGRIGLKHGLALLRASFERPGPGVGPLACPATHQ